MDKQTAYMLGKVFKLGMIYAQGKAHKDRKLALDDPKWITVHPNGKENKGRPALLDGETGEVLGGMGGKFNGKHISAVPEHGKNEQMGAQMRVNAKNHKADLMNGQNIGFSKTNKAKKNNPIQTPNGNLSTKTQKRLNTVKENTNKYANNNLSNVTDKELHDHYKELEKSIQAYSSSLYSDNQGKESAIENLYRKDPDILNAKNEQERILNVLSNRYGMGDIEKDPNKRPFKFLLPNNATYGNERDNQIRLVLNKAENSNKVTKSETNQPAEKQTINKQNNKVSFNGYDFDNISEAKDFLYDAEKNIRGHREDITNNTAKLKQANKDLVKLQTLNRFYQDYEKDNPLFEKSFTEYLKDNKANYKGIKSNELPDLRASKYWGGGYRDSERAINTLKNAYERVSDNLKRKNTEIRDLNRDIEYARERIPRLQKLIKIGNETISKLEK